MKPKIETIIEKKFVGIRTNMTLAEDKTYEQWHSFMPRKKEIESVIGSDLYSLQVYQDGAKIQHFTPTTPFEKWAAVAVSEINDVPFEMESLTVPKGMYAVFIHQGDQSTFPNTMQHILTEWLPDSGYELDDRPHFQVMGEKYKNNDPSSEEEVWVPICK